MRDQEQNTGEQDLADRRQFLLDVDQWSMFQAALDAPPRLLPRLKALLEEPGFFDTTKSATPAAKTDCD